MLQYITFYFIYQVTFTYFNLIFNSYKEILIDIKYIDTTKKVLGLHFVL